MKLKIDRSFPSELQSLVAAANARLSASHAVERLWARDHRLWKQDPTDITNRLGWLTIIEYMKDRTEELRTFATSAKKRGIRDVVLLGMGGSSLGPEVLRASFGSSRGFPRLWVLDSTIPGWVRQVTQAIDPARSLFILASKSGGTIEVMSLFAHFWEHVHQTRGHQAGEQFLAITDPGTGLEKLAAEHQFWRIFTSPPDIGGRYSVLSYFGLVPAALMGIDVTQLLTRAAAMAQACRIQSPLGQNPGAELGATMAALAQAGRNKVTLVASPQIASFGLWAEQLLAESTGKEGTGLIPVANEPIVSATAYGTDRLFVYLRLKGDQNRQLDRQIAGLAREGHPVLSLTLQDRYDLAGEFFRWEVATSLAGHLLGIHPFDQPNVQESKDNTARVLETIQSTGRLPKQTTATAAQAAATTNAIRSTRGLRRHLGLYDALLQDGAGHSLAAKSARFSSPCDHDGRLWSALSPFDRPAPQGGSEERTILTTRRSDDARSRDPRKTVHLSHPRAGPSSRRHTGPPSSWATGHRPAPGQEPGRDDSGPDKVPRASHASSTSN